MGDREQPRAQVADLTTATQGAPRLHERLLHRILGGDVPDDTPAVAKQQWTVALDDRLEGRLVTFSAQSNQVLVVAFARRPPGAAAR